MAENKWVTEVIRSYNPTYRGPITPLITGSGVHQLSPPENQQSRLENVGKPLGWRAPSCLTPQEAL